MGTFNELIHVIKDFCDEKDKKIAFLQNKIDLMNKERYLLKKKFIEGDYETLKIYYSVEK